MFGLESHPKRVRYFREKIQKDLEEAEKNGSILIWGCDQHEERAEIRNPWVTPSVMAGGALIGGACGYLYGHNKDELVASQTHIPQNSKIGINAIVNAGIGGLIGFYAPTITYLVLTNIRCNGMNLWTHLYETGEDICYAISKPFRKKENKLEPR